MQTKHNRRKPTQLPRKNITFNMIKKNINISIFSKEKIIFITECDSLTKTVIYLTIHSPVINNSKSAWGRFSTDWHRISRTDKILSICYLRWIAKYSIHTETTKSTVKLKSRRHQFCLKWLTLHKNKNTVNIQKRLPIYTIGSWFCMPIVVARLRAAIRRRQGTRIP